MNLQLWSGPRRRARHAGHHHDLPYRHAPHRGLGNAPCRARARHCQHP